MGGANIISNVESAIAMQIKYALDVDLWPLTTSKVMEFPRIPAMNTTGIM